LLFGRGHKRSALAHSNAQGRSQLGVQDGRRVLKLATFADDRGLAVAVRLFR